MKVKGLTSAFLLTVLVMSLISGCTWGRHHIEEDDDTAVKEYDLGVAGVMPTIGHIYIDNVEVQSATDGTTSGLDMLKFHQKYTLSSDIIVDDKSSLEGGMCIWESSDKDAVFSNGTLSIEVPLQLNASTDTYECSNVSLDVKKDGTINMETYNPDSIISVSYKNNRGEFVTQSTIGTVSPYVKSITLNVADRHNLKNVATSPATVLFWRKDGLFQAGFTAYRGMTGLQQYIGSAIYEAKVKAPGGTTIVSRSLTTADYDADVQADITRMNTWTANDAVDTNNGIYSTSAFVSSYGPPIALPAFRKGEVNYNRLRTALLRHNHYPIVISADKKLYVIGGVTNFDASGLGGDLEDIYSKQIRVNDIWFSYSGVNLGDNPDLTKIHAGEIKTVNGVESKFVSLVAITSDLDTTIALNETDREYYISGNPNLNNGFCSNKVDKVMFESPATDDQNYILAFNYNMPCGSYDASAQVGAVKIPGLQKLIGDGGSAVATDSHIYFTGRDGKGYMVDLRPNSENYQRIMEGRNVKAELVPVPHSESNHNHTEDDWNNRLYAVEMAYANMNHAVSPTLLLKDGSIVFMARQYKNGAVQYISRHIYLNKNLDLSINEADHPTNVKIVHLLGPTAGYGEDGRIYFWTDMPSLGVSYKPSKTNIDDDYLAFIYGDPVQLISMLTTEADKEKAFGFYYSVIDVEGTVSRFGNNALGNNFAIMPYNPLTATIEDVLVTEDEQGNISYTLQALPYRPFRTNTYLVVNLNAQSDYSYIMVPYYVYGLDSAERAVIDNIIYKQDGAMAAETKGNNISKVYGAYNIPNLPFRYTPYGRNSVFFANKKGVFSFVDYNVRKSKSRCQDTGSCAGDSNIKLDTELPDYFYSATKSNNYLEEASGKNNYISTPFVTEVRMSNFPDTRNYASTGFEPQLLSSYFNYEYDRIPSNSGENAAADPLLPGYIPQFWFETVKGRFTNYATMQAADYLKDLYQYDYGVGLYRYYTKDSFPMWRARKINTEVLQYQTRFGNLMPMSHGATAESYVDNMVSLFKDTPYVDSTDLNKYVAPREYVHSLYVFYDKEQLEVGGDLGSSVFGSLTTPMTDTEIRNNGIGYIMVEGNFMWKNTPAALTGTGAVPLDSFEFVQYH